MTEDSVPYSERSIGEAGIPSLEPPQLFESNGGNAMIEDKPTLIPPSVSTATTTSAGETAPSLTPDSLTGAEAGAYTAVNSDKRVTALWGINQNRNSWAHIAGVGWKKLANNSDSAVVALTILAAHAKQSQTNYTYRDESDGMIHESYVW
jgi:hypothetical protein